MRPPQPLFLPALFASCFFLLAPSLPGQSPETTPPETAPTPSIVEHQRGKLQLGKPIEHELRGGEADIYTIKVRRGQFLHVVVEQRGIDVVVALVAPDGKRIVEADSPNGAWGPEPASLIADAAGIYHIRIESGDGSAAPGKYELTITDLRKPIPTDQTRITAERTLFEAAQLGAQPAADSQRKAIAAFEKALPLWEILGDHDEIAVTLVALGSAHLGLGEGTLAIELEQKGLEQWNGLKFVRGKGLVLLNIGMAYDVLEQREKALAVYKAALEATQAECDQATEGVVLNQLGLDNDIKGDLHAAVSFYEKALQIDRAVGFRTAEVTVLVNIAVSYAKLGERQKALEKLLQALPIASEMHNLNAQAHILGDLGVLYSENGDTQKGLHSFNEALPLFRTLKDRSEEAHTLAGIGKTYVDTGQPLKGIEFYDQSLAIVHETGNRREQEITLTQLGSAFSGLGDRQKALDCYMQVLEISRSISDRSEESISLSNIGFIYYSSGDYEKALDFFNQSLQIDRELHDRVGESTTLNNIGAAYDSLGDKKRALDYMIQALGLLRAVEDRQGEASCLNNIGRLYRDLGQYEKALDYFEQSLRIERELHNVSREAAALQNLGAIYSSLHQYEKALDTFVQALQLARSSSDPAVEAQILHNLGQEASDAGETEKALDYYNQALTLNRSVGNRLGESETLNNIAWIYFRLGNRSQALDNYVPALLLAHAIKNPLVEATVLSNLMLFWKDGGSPAQAVVFGKQAVTLYQKVRTSMRGLEKESLRSFLESHAKTYRDLADLLISQGRLPEAEFVLDLLKQEEYFDFIRRDGASADSLTKPVSLTSEEQKILAEYEKIADEVTAIDAEWSQLRAKPDRTHDEEQRFSDLTEKLKAANDRMELYFHDLYTAFAGGKLEKKNVEQVREETSGIQSLVAELGPGTVALYTLVTESNYRVIVITPNAMQPREYPIPQAELWRKVAALLASLRNPQGDPLAASQDLYTILIAPIEKDLRGAKAKTLMWSLDGVLRYVPISALHDGKQYMVENYRNVVFTPASISRLKDQPGPKSDRGLGMGVSKDYDGLGPLPQVPQELRSIIHDDSVQGARGVIPGTMMLDDSFTEKNMEKALEQRHRLIHIASHFVLQPGNESDSYLLLGGKDEGGKGYHLTLAELRTDPRLTFSDTDLLTLSACQTATSISAADGHEVDGLGILAQQRGAKAVMATLWSVDDESTAMLMTDFYSRWTQHPDINKAEALRLGQLSMLRGTQQTGSSADTTAGQANLASQRQFSHPYFWAPFILIGNWK